MNFSLSGGDQQPAKNDKKKGKDPMPKDIEKQKKDWFDWWLSDDPPAPAAKDELRQARLKQANTYTPRGSKPADVTDQDALKTGQTNVTINLDFSKIKLPKVKAPKLNLPAWPYKKIAIIAIGLVVVVVPGTIIYKNHQKQVQADKLKAAEQALANQPSRSKPSFVPLAPKDNPDLVKLGTKSNKVAYDGQRDTLSYIDTFNANNLTVSEQPLPANSGNAQQIVAKAASQIDAKTPILLDGDNVAYLHSESKSSAQTVVFSKNNLLIFINSGFTHDTAAYKAYIENLQ